MDETIALPNGDVWSFSDGQWTLRAPASADTSTDQVSQ